MGPNNGKSNMSQKLELAGSPAGLQKTGRKLIVGVKLPFSPRTKVPIINKVFVLGTQLGFILLRTQRPNNNDDAFTQDAVKLIEDDTTGAAARLNIIKICSRRQSKLVDQAIMQNSNYPSRWFVSIIPEESNTAEYRAQHAENFIKFLNNIDWKYPQQFIFQGDETKLMNGRINTSVDMFLLNCDIVVLLKVYLFEHFEDFLGDNGAVTAVLGNDGTAKDAKLIFFDLWAKLCNNF
jgi:hypothetical protein